MLAKMVERCWIEDMEDIWVVSQQALQAQTTLVTLCTLYWAVLCVLD